MPILKSFLKEELGNSLRMRKAYERELAHLPEGVLVSKKIKGHFYHYLVFRDNGKVRCVYKGKASQDEIKRFRDAKKRRAFLRPLLSRVKQQILFLKKVLHDRKLQFMS